MRYYVNTRLLGNIKNSPPRAPPPLDLVVVVVEKALEDHDTDPKDQISDHIPPQAPQWEPTWHYYNTC